MDRSELEFREGCRKWHAYFEHCAKDGKLTETLHLVEKVKQYLEEWKSNLDKARIVTREAEKRVLECRKQEASIYSRLRMLKQLLEIVKRNQ